MHGICRLTQMDSIEEELNIDYVHMLSWQHWSTLNKIIAECYPNWSYLYKHIFCLKVILAVLLWAQWTSSFSIDNNLFLRCSLAFRYHLSVKNFVDKLTKLKLREILIQPKNLFCWNHLSFIIAICPQAEDEIFTIRGW